MESIVYVGMDVHKESFTICCFQVGDDEVKHSQKINSDYKLVLKYLDRVRQFYDDDVKFVCGYEAGCLGYSLYNDLTNHHVECKILAPSTMGIHNTHNIKTDRRDAANIAQCLAYRTYSSVYVPTDEDNEIKEFIRMRDDQKLHLKKTKQQILAFILRQGKKFNGGKCYWTGAHIKWLKTLELSVMNRETLNEYLITYEYLIDKIERLDQRIEELANQDKYREKVNNMNCFLGVKTHTSLSIIVEIGDFNRFKTAPQFASFLGLVPGEHSSSEDKNRFGITKAGNSHLRRLLVEASQSFAKGAVGHKSAGLKKRQEGNPPEVIAYADKANERLRRKYYRLTLKNNVKRNIAVTAVARELACFIWGMETGNIA